MHSASYQGHRSFYEIFDPFARGCPDRECLLPLAVSLRVKFFKLQCTNQDRVSESRPPVREYRPLICYLQSKSCSHIEDGPTPSICGGHSGDFAFISPLITRSPGLSRSVSSRSANLVSKVMLATISHAYC